MRLVITLLYLSFFLDVAAVESHVGSRPGQVAGNAGVGSQGDIVADVEGRLGVPLDIDVLDRLLDSLQSDESAHWRLRLRGFELHRSFTSATQEPRG